MLEWGPAPFRVEFGRMPNGMVMTDVAIDKDHTLTMYCEKEMIPFVIETLKKIVNEP